MHLTKTLCIRLSAAVLAACTLTTSCMAAPGVVTARDGLRLRAASHSSSQILSTLDVSTIVEVLEAVDDSWYRVSVGGQTGFVSSQYVTLTTTGTQPSSPAQPTQPETPSDPEPPAQPTTPDTPQPLYGVINADSLNIRSGPASSYSKVGVLARGEQVTLLEYVDNWYRIEGGYISAQYVQITDPPQPSTPSDPPAQTTDPGAPQHMQGVITADSLNIRSGPGSSYSKVGTLAQGENVTLLEFVDNWYRIETGYISAQYVEITYVPEDPAPSDPPPQTDPTDPTQPSGSLTGVISTSTLNIRSGPGSSYDKVGTLSSGTEVTLLEEVDGWYRVEGGYISAQYVTVMDNSMSELQARIVAYARTFLGCDYVYGGNGPTAFDCSGLTQYVYKHFGYSIHRGATQQLKNGVAVEKANLQPGDLVFFNSAGTGVNRATHVGIYIGDGQFLHASAPKVGVKISDLYSAYYKSVYTTARRII